MIGGLLATGKFCLRKQCKHDCVMLLGMEFRVLCNNANNNYVKQDYDKHKHMHACMYIYMYVHVLYMPSVPEGLYYYTYSE